MEIGPACYTIAPARAISVRGPMFPWQREYRVAKQEMANAPWFAQRVQSGAEIGRRLFTMEPLKQSSWFLLDLQPLGTTLFGDNALIPDDVPTLDTVVSGPRVLKEWTPAKALVTYYLASGQTRQVRFDIGNGVTVGLPPTNHVEVDLLVWSDDDLDEIVAPPTAEALRGHVDFATTVSCKATAVPYASTLPKARFTQLVYLPGDTVNRQVQVPLVEQVDAVQLLAGAIPPSVADLVIGDIGAIYRTEFTDTAQGVAPDGLSAVMPAFLIDFDTPHISRRVEVPHTHANVVRLVMVPNDKFANVIVSQEIY